MKLSISSNFEILSRNNFVFLWFPFFKVCTKDDLVVKCTNEKIPYFNSPVYLENKEKIGKVDEIFGPIHDYYISVKVSLL